jgi:hypothetical protein
MRKCNMPYSKKPVYQGEIILFAASMVGSSKTPLGAPPP